MQDSPPKRRGRPWGKQPPPIEPVYYDVTDVDVVHKTEDRSLLKNGPQGAAVLACLSRGLTRSAAAAKAGMSRKTIDHWIRTDQAFAESVERAEGLAEARATELVADAWESDWKAAWKWLERRRARDWGSQEAAELASLTTMLAEQAGLTADEVKDAIREAERLRLESWRSGIKGSS